MGVISRPRISDRLTFIGHAASAPARGFTWSGFVGLDLPRLVRGALELGYKGLGIDVTGGDEDIVRNYDMTHYWPFVGFRLHWGR